MSSNAQIQKELRDLKEKMLLTELKKVGKDMSTLSRYDDSLSIDMYCSAEQEYDRLRKELDNLRNKSFY